MKNILAGVLLASISPCPMTANVAALVFLVQSA
jgi:hypothetical protein